MKDCPFPQNSAPWLLWSNAEQKKALIKTRLADIERAQSSIQSFHKDIAEAQLFIADAEELLGALTAAEPTA